MAGFDEFFEDHYDEVVRSLTLAVGDRGRAEDAAQEAFARAYRNWASVSGMERPVGWVLVVAMNQLRRWFVRSENPERERHRHLAVALTSIDGVSGAVADHADTVVSAASMRAALDRLSPRQRATVVLRVLCDLPIREVAKALSCSPGTVKSALHSALANLRVELGDDEARRIAGDEEANVDATR